MYAIRSGLDTSNEKQTVQKLDPESDGSAKPY